MDFVKMAETKNRNGNTETERRKEIHHASYSTVILFCSFLVRLLHAGQRGD